MAKRKPNPAVTFAFRVGWRSWLVPPLDPNSGILPELLTKSPNNLYVRYSYLKKAGYNYTFRNSSGNIDIHIQSELWSRAVSEMYEWKVAQEDELLGNERLGVWRKSSGASGQELYARACSTASAKYILRNALEKCIVQATSKGHDYSIRAQSPSMFAISSKRTYPYPQYGANDDVITYWISRTDVHEIEWISYFDSGGVYHSETLDYISPGGSSEYIPGDPTILRDSSNGQFGSYPSYEGDDEAD
ncbi:hypothetical protein E7T09_13010 [Deinococcus sp. KSM4-11]|uniref:hypothetical protein n=1 Tax=Deinococcus sp. KSM4-11 TaxID=2568654 RepID=UPI0010A4BB78|nr:hypothetical protein [Deinococcus sp. KSM4-11]THF86144.1 hypothetical protein E7T09_13010 [Deinococcus sp. KSM4-11]